MFWSTSLSAEFVISTRKSCIIAARFPSASLRRPSPLIRDDNTVIEMTGEAGNGIEEHVRSSDDLGRGARRAER